MTDEFEWTLPDGAEIMTTREDGHHVLTRIIGGVWYPVHGCHSAETIERMAKYDRMREGFAQHVVADFNVTFEHPVYRSSGTA